MADTKKIIIQAEYKDGVSSKMRGLTSSTNNFSKSAQGAEKATKGFKGQLDSTSKVVAGFLGAQLLSKGFSSITGFMGDATQAFAGFETRMSNISTLLDSNVTPTINEMSSGILELIKTVPKSADELGASAYDIFSAGVTDASDALVVLEASSKLAVGGLGNTQGATDLMTSAINAFGLDAANSDKIANTLFKTVKFGKTTVDQIAQAFGSTAPIVASAGISLEDFSAATAALTTTGTPAAQAQNQLRAAIVSLSKPTAEMRDLYEKIGVEGLPQLIKKGGDLGGVFELLRKAAGGNNQVLLKAFGRVEGFNAALGVGQTVNESYTQTLEDMRSGSESLEGAFQKQADTLSNKLVLNENELVAKQIELGEKTQDVTLAFENAKLGAQELAIDGFLFAGDAIGDFLHVMTGTNKELGLTDLEMDVLKGGLESLGLSYETLTEDQKTFVDEQISTFQDVGTALEMVKLKQEQWNLEALRGVDEQTGKIKELSGAQREEIVTALTDIIVKNGEVNEEFTEGVDKMKEDYGLFNDEIKELTDKAVKQSEKRIGSLGKESKTAIAEIQDFSKKAVPKIELLNQKLADSNKKLETMALKAIAARQELADIGSNVASAGATAFTGGKKRAGGGSVRAGETYLVGERGMETFTPDTNGRITPNGQTVNNNNNNNQKTININVQGNELKLKQVLTIAERI